MKGTRFLIWLFIAFLSFCACSTLGTAFRETKSETAFSQTDHSPCMSSSDHSSQADFSGKIDLLNESDSQSSAETISENRTVYSLDSTVFSEFLYTREWFDYLHQQARYSSVWRSEEKAALFEKWKNNNIWEDAPGFLIVSGGGTTIQPVKAEEDDFKAFPWLKEEYTQILDILDQNSIPIWNYRDEGIPAVPDPKGLMLIHELPASLNPFSSVGLDHEPAPSVGTIYLYTIQTKSTAQFLIAEFSGEYTIFAIRSIYEKNYDNGNPCFDASRGVLTLHSNEQSDNKHLAYDTSGSIDTGNIFIIRWEDKTGEERFLWLSCDLFYYNSPIDKPIPQFHHISMNENMDYGRSESRLGNPSETSFSFYDEPDSLWSSSDLQDAFSADSTAQGDVFGAGKPVLVFDDGLFRLYRPDITVEEHFSRFMVIYNEQKAVITKSNFPLSNAAVLNACLPDYSYVFFACTEPDLHDMSQGYYFFFGIFDNGDGTFSIDWLH